MNILWTIIMLCSIAAMVVIKPDDAVKAMTEGANNAVSLAITLLASYSLWLGFFRLVEKTGISKAVARLIRKPLNFLFPSASERAKSYLSMNISANFLGLGNAATPMGINAVCALDDGAERANTDMIMALVLSSTSLQLLPGTVIAMRVARGAAAPVSFLPANIIATIASTVIGISLVKILSAAGRRRASEKASKKNNNRGIARKKSGEKSFMRGSAGEKA